MLQRKQKSPGSAFSETKQLEEWGWKNAGSETTGERFRQLVGNIEQSMNELGVGIKTSDGNIYVQSLHSESTTHNGKTYPATQAKYFEIYNPSKGAIIACRKYCPAWVRNNVATFPKDAHLPDLQNWSDNVYLTWSSLTSVVQRMSLRYIVRIDVQNEDTNYIVSQALEKVACIAIGAPPAWPGYTFTP